MALSHDDLARSLADHLRGPDSMVWCDIQLGPSGSPRPDVYTVFKSFVRPTPMAYECKVSMSDFRADVTTGKWQSYLPFASGVYFACEAGLIGKGDIPEHCGLIVLTNGSWRAQRKATLRVVTVPQDALLKLLIDGVEREGPRQRAKAWSESEYLDKMRARFGEITAKAVRDRLAVEYETEGARRTAKRIIDDAAYRADQIKQDAQTHVAPLREELCTVLGLPLDTDRWTMARAVNDLRASIAEHPANTKLIRLTRSIENALSRHGAKEAVAEVVT